MKTLKGKIESFEMQAIIKALQESGWVKAEAARRIGITERMIGYKIKKYGINKEVEHENIQQTETDELTTDNKTITMKEKHK